MAFALVRVHVKFSFYQVLHIDAQGYGTQFYTDEEYYEGEWYADKRSGWGRMYYADGAVYEGEWFDDERNGQGMLRLGSLLYFYTIFHLLMFCLSEFSQKFKHILDN